MLMISTFGSNLPITVRQINSKHSIPILSSALAEPDALKALNLLVGNTTGPILACVSPRGRIVHDRRC